MIKALLMSHAINDGIHAVLCHHLKRWGDRYPFTAEVKGGIVHNLRPPSVAVTSNYSPGDIWSAEADLAPIERRFTF